MQIMQNTCKWHAQIMKKNAKIMQNMLMHILADPAIIKQTLTKILWRKIKLLEILNFEGF